MRRVLAGTQTASFWIDDSGSVSGKGTHFVMAGIKTRHPDDVQRALRVVVDKHQMHRQELKFSKIDAASYPLFRDLIDALEETDVHLAATVVELRTGSPLRGLKTWDLHATVAGRLVMGNLNRNEIAAVQIDSITTPPGVAVGTQLKRFVNGSLRATAVVSAVSLDSKSNLLLQVADTVAGAVHSQRVVGARSAEPNEKQRVASRLAAAFGLRDFADTRSERVSIRTLDGRETPARTFR